MDDIKLSNYEINILQDALIALADSINTWTIDEYRWAEELQALSMKLEDMKSKNE